MLQRVTMNGIELPRLYIAENKADAEFAMSKGIPFVRWTKGQDALIKMLLRPVLEKMFPHIKWNKVLGPKRRFKTKVHVSETVVQPDPIEVEEEREEDELDLDLGLPHDDDDPALYGTDVELEDDGDLVEHAGISSNERLFAGGSEMVVTHNLDIEDYIGDLSSSVDLEVLQRLRLMPSFIGDILDCIKTNVGSGLQWREGYNKRLGIPVGRFDAARQLPNLIILDVSGSIPRGISATMISLIDTLRTQLSADLIITSTNSRFYPMGSDLPDPQRIRDMFGYGNEAVEFNEILKRHVQGRHFGHVFSFGDNDTPYYYLHDNPIVTGTVVECVHHYHTGFGYGERLKTGYAKWCDLLSRKPIEEYDTSWCKVIEN